MQMALGYIQHIGQSIMEDPGQLKMLPGGKMAFAYIISLLIGDWHLRRNERLLSFSKNPTIRMVQYLLIYISIIFYSSMFESSKSEIDFIYFQF
jgi:hypothetical protein